MQKQMDQTSQIYVNDGYVDKETLRNWYTEISKNPREVRNTAEVIKMQCSLEKDQMHELKVPVIHRNCEGHDQACYDLQQILKKLGSEKKEIVCKETKCATKPKISDIDQLQLSGIHMIASKFMHYTNIDVRYQIKANGDIFFCQQYRGEIEKVFVNHVTQFQYLVNQEVNKDQQFTTIYRRIDSKKIDFYAICALKHTKIILPVRHKKCNHIEAYDFGNLLQFLSEKKNKHLNCRVDNCKTNYPKDINELVPILDIDYELLHAINKGVSFSYIFRVVKPYQQEKWEIKNIAVFETDPFLNRLGKEIDKVQLQLIEKFCYSKADVLIKLEIPKNSQIFLQKEQFKKGEINMIDSLTDFLIQIPVRCIHCPSREYVTDIMSFLFHIHQHIQSKTKENLKCILCNKELIVKNPNQYLDKIYVDKPLLELIMRQTQSYFGYKKLILDGKQRLREDLKNFKKLSIENYLQTSSNIIVFRSLKCSITGQKLSMPIILENCRGHPNGYVDFDSYFDLIVQHDMDTKKVQKPCEVCPQPNSINDFIYDAMLGGLLDKFGQTFDFNKALKFNISTKKYEQINIGDADKEINNTGSIRPQVDESVSRFTIPLFPQEYEKYKEMFAERNVGGDVFSTISFCNAGVWTTLTDMDVTELIKLFDQDQNSEFKVQAFTLNGQTFDRNRVAEIKQQRIEEQKQKVEQEKMEQEQQKNNQQQQQQGLQQQQPDLQAFKKKYFRYYNLSQDEIKFQLSQDHQIGAVQQLPAQQGHTPTIQPIFDQIPLNEPLPQPIPAPIEIIWIPRPAQQSNPSQQQFNQMQFNQFQPHLNQQQYQGFQVIFFNQRQNNQAVQFNRYNQLVQQPADGQGMLNQVPQQTGIAQQIQFTPVSNQTTQQQTNQPGQTQKKRNIQLIE